MGLLSPPALKLDRRPLPPERRFGITCCWLVAEREAFRPRVHTTWLRANTLHILLKTHEAAVRAVPFSVTDVVGLRWAIHF